MKFIWTVPVTTTDSGRELENYAPNECPHLPVHIDNSSCYVIEDKFWVPFVRSQVRYLHISHVPVSTSSQYRLDRAILYQVRQQPLVWIIMDQFWRVLITVHSTLDYYILGFWICPSSSMINSLQHFQDWIYFCPQECKTRKAPTELGLIDLFLITSQILQIKLLDTVFLSGY
jgi:hypothetical protein